MSSVFRAALLAAFAIVIVIPVLLLGRQRLDAAPQITRLEAPPMSVRELSIAPDELRVCADPNNLPFSNEHGEGFENAIAGLVARELGRHATFYWLPQRRGFVRNSLTAGLCDLIAGVPAGYDLVRTTRPYYRSSYVFVSRRTAPPLHSFDDPALRHMRIGIQVTGDDYQNPPAAEALAFRHLEANVHGYPVYGDYSSDAPQRAIVDDVAANRIDTAIVWGPVGGYFGSLQQSPLTITAVSPARDPAAGPFTFAIAMGVRKTDAALGDEVDRVLVRRRAEIQRILRRFHVPLVEAGDES
jgi:mxaJ protein